MLFSRITTLFLILLVALPTAWTETQKYVAQEVTLTETPRQVRRYYQNLSRYPLSGYAIVLQAEPGKMLRIARWLDEIFAVPYGRQTIEAILDSGHRLLIRDTDWALAASGRTLAPVSNNLINGRGEDVEILFDARIPDNGSHHVFDKHRQPIEFTAVQNLFHELVHARHKMNGTWHYFDSEGQAIEEENIFRVQYGERSGRYAVRLRSGSDGVQLWWPQALEIRVSRAAY